MIPIFQFGRYQFSHSITRGFSHFSHQISPTSADASALCSKDRSSHAFQLQEFQKKKKKRGKSNCSWKPDSSHRPQTKDIEASLIYLQGAALVLFVLGLHYTSFSHPPTHKSKVTKWACCWLPAAEEENKRTKSGLGREKLSADQQLANDLWRGRKIEERHCGVVGGGEQSISQ